jgi:hypothetical protein
MTDCFFCFLFDKRKLFIEKKKMKKKTNLVESNLIVFHNYYLRLNHQLQGHFQEDHHHQQYVILVVQEVFYVLQFF